MVKKKICGNCTFIDPDNSRKAKDEDLYNDTKRYRCKKHSKWVGWYGYCHLWKKWTWWDELKWQLRHWKDDDE